MPQGLSIRAYAQHRGVRHSAVQKALKAQRITRLPDGSIDPAAADLAWANNTDQRKPLNSVSGNPKHKRDAPAPAAAPRSAGADLPFEPSPLTRAHTTKAEIGAKREQMKLAIELKRLVSAEEVQDSLFAAGRRGRDRLISWAVKVKQARAAATDQAEFDKLVDDAVADIIAEMSTPFGTMAEPDS